MILPLEVKAAIQVRIDGSADAPYCESRVEEIAPDELIISWPAHAGERIAVRELQAIRVSFSREMQAFEFDATVLDVIDDPVPLLSVRPLGPLRSIQRREDVRIRAHVPVDLAARVVGLARYRDTRARTCHIRSETVTISAGGFAIYYPSAIAPGTLFEVKMKLPGEGGMLVMSAQCVRCDLLGDPETQPARFEAGFSFTRISQAARARIVRFVFGLQLEERSDG
jgi:c-di-GMP-binding flagellar brake protein YcgR